MNAVQRTLPEKAEVVAKANLRKPEVALKERIGRAITRARELCGWTLDRLAREVERDPRQVARWEKGTEPPQFHLLFAIKEFQKPLVVALAELAHVGVEIDTVIRVRMKESA